MKYEVLMAFGNYQKGNILDFDNPKHRTIIKRKLQEVGTIKEIREEKMNKINYENKMIEKSDENKGGKK